MPTNFPPKNTCQYWSPNEPATCTYWNGTTCAYVAEGKDKSMPSAYPKCNTIGTYSLCTKYSSSSGPGLQLL